VAHETLVVPVADVPGVVDTPPPANGAPGKATTRINKLISMGLVNEPNIEDFRLPNEAAPDETTTPQEEEDTVSLKLINPKLGLPEDATEAQSIAAIGKLQGDITAANAKVADGETALANMVKDRNNTPVEAALANGQITGADKATWESRLANAFATESANLAALPKKPVKTEPATGGRAPQSAGDKKLGEELMALANAAQKENPGLSFDDAWAKVRRDHPEKFQKPAPQKA